MRRYQPKSWDDRDMEPHATGDWVRFEDVMALCRRMELRLTQAPGDPTVRVEYSLVTPLTVRDAARYEWIRANQSTAAYLLLNNMMAEAGDILDAKVDRARGAKDGGATPG